MNIQNDELPYLALAKLTPGVALFLQNWRATRHHPL